MSAALNAVVEELHITAARKLMELLESVKDPALLSRLIATALRYKVAAPRNKAAAQTAGPATEVADGGRASRPPQPTPPPHPPTSNDIDEDDEPDPPTPSGLKPLTEQELALLKLQIGPVEAERRRLVRLHILKEEAARAAEHNRREHDHATRNNAAQSAA